MPRITDKKVAELIATLSDSHHFLDTTTYHLKDLNVLLDMCGNANAAVMSYALFDLKNTLDPKSDQTTIQLQIAKGIERNTLIFQDELELLQPFMIRCVAKQVPLLNEFAASLRPEEFTENRHAGLQRFRNGVFAIYSSVLQTTNNSLLRESYREKVLQAVAENSALYSSTLKPEERRKILDLAKSSQAATPGFLQKYFDKITYAMAEVSCDGLCKF
jgi:hypothetical protein